MRLFGLICAILVFALPGPAAFVTVPLAILFCPTFIGEPNASLYEMLRRSR